MKYLKFLLRGNYIRLNSKDLEYSHLVDVGIYIVEPNKILPSKYCRLYGIYLPQNLFYVNGTSVCKSLKKMIADMFKCTKVRITKKGITIILTRDPKLTAEYIQNNIMLSKGTPLEFYKLLDTIEWLKKLTPDEQRRAYYDRTKKRCILQRRNSGNNKVLLSPRSRKLTCWGRSRMHDHNDNT